MEEVGGSVGLRGALEYVGAVQLLVTISHIPVALHQICPAPLHIIILHSLHGSIQSSVIMGKRKLIPTELHSELSEYSSLLRALRTSHTLDLSSQLTQRQSSPQSGSTSQEDLDQLIVLDDADRSEDDLRKEADAHTLEAMAADTCYREARPSASQTPGKKKSDTWTRWPLLAGDVLVPEWRFEDEIKLFALHVLRSHYHQDAASDEDDWDEEFESSAWASSLAQVSSLHLSRILALLATHTPIGNKSMQNRINPVGWEMVINALGAYGSDFIDETSVLHFCMPIYLCF